ncbi:MAG: ACP S-malonyltransferase [Sedimentisphaerales bacterium]|nr:ACP S-malonyltransferase [Sedimentisphaerales bacterium]
MKTAFLFPGQGAQSVGMGKDIAQTYPSCAHLFEKANQIVGYDLRQICFEGPEEKLNSTTISQPAIFVLSAAILDILRSEPATSEIAPDVTAGLSLGEYTALYAAGAISFEDALVLVQKRGNLMQAAADASNGSMVSILGLDEDKVSRLCKEAAGDSLLTAVNFNCPGQIVISGDVDACNRAAELAEKYGAIKAVILKVAGAFHTSMMQPAADALKEALDACDISKELSVKVIANIDTQYYTSDDHIRTGLVKQLVQPLLWQRCMEKLLEEGVENFYEIGPGRVLTGLMKRINRKTKVINVSDLGSIQKLQALVTDNC